MELPPEINKETRGRLLTALAKQSVNFKYDALYLMARNGWTQYTLTKALIRDINAGLRIYKKYAQGGTKKILPDVYQCNAEILEESGDLYYVELKERRGAVDIRLRIGVHLHETVNHLPR